MRFALLQLAYAGRALDRANGRFKQASGRDTEVGRWRPDAAVDEARRAVLIP